MSHLQRLLSLAREHVPVELAVRDCWDFVVRGIELGWLDVDELRDLLEHLRSHRDFGVEELLFAHVGELMRVSFLDDYATCSPSALIEDLAALST